MIKDIPSLKNDTNNFSFESDEKGKKKKYLIIKIIINKIKYKNI